MIPSSRNQKGGGAKAPFPRGRGFPKRPLPYILAGAGVFLFFVLFLSLRHGVNLRLPILALRLGILTAASVSDLYSRKVANAYSLAMLITGFHSPESLCALLRRGAGMAALFLFLYVLYRVFPQKTMGGADIKMLSALTFVLGRGILPVLVYLLGLSILMLLVLLLLRGKTAFRARVPFFPLMTAAVWLYYLI